MNNVDYRQSGLVCCRHCLVVFGGVKGLEASLDADPDLRVEDPSLLFHHYLNTCPGQGSHTIRTEVSRCGLQSRFLSGSELEGYFVVNCDSACVCTGNCSCWLGSSRDCKRKARHTLAHARPDVSALCLVSRKARR